MTLETFRKIVDPKKGLTRAQVFYRQLVQHTFDEKTSIGRKNLKELYGVSGEREQVRIKAKLIRQTADKYFQFIGNPQLSETLFKELKKQQEDTRRRLKKEAVANSMMLYHATPLAKEDLDGGVLRGNTERSDFVLEKTFIGVCATPISNGAFAIKKVKNEYDFSCRGDNLIILTDNRLNGKKDNELLGYMHGHKITADDGFMPTVSLGGDIAGEWTTEKNVSIDFSEKITLNSLKEKGVHIFSISKKDKEFVKKTNSRKNSQRTSGSIDKNGGKPSKRIYRR